jgi:N-acetylglucosaminyldiphosphoundecaprenol N-acetyl-beta-D-mannosaminyltransferase
MARCDCGESISLFSFYPVCSACLRGYLDELPRRPGYTIKEWQIDRQHARQAATARTRVSVAPQRIRLLDTLIDPVTLADAMAEIESYVEAGQPHQLVTVNVDFVRIAQENEQFRRVVNNSHLSVADGKPLLWAARWTGQELPARITGMDLVLGSAALAAKRAEPIFLLGAAEGIAANAAAVLQENFPGLKVHFYSPPFGPFSEDENAKMVRLIRESGAKYLFVAFGAPKQDVWINDHLAELQVPVCAGIGGVLNFLAGSISRAPQWMQRYGLEWVYRIMQEPTRLWRRYFLEDLPVFVRMLMEPVAAPATAAPRSAYQPATGATTASAAYELPAGAVASFEAQGGGR